MAKQTFVADTILTAAQMNSLQSNDYNQTVSTKTASYTLIASDAGTKIVMNAGATNTTITVNTSLFSAGDTLTILNTSTSGTCTITAGTATVATAGSLALGLNQGGTLYFTSAGVSVFEANGVAGTSLFYAVFNETQASGTDGGGSTAGSYIKRTLNTTIVNTISGCSLATSVITLPAGTYSIQGFSPIYKSNQAAIRLRNTTDSTTDIKGISSYFAAGNNGAGNAQFIGHFTIAGNKNFELQYFVASAQASNGLGVAASTGESEVYSVIQITKVA